MSGSQTEGNEVLSKCNVVLKDDFNEFINPMLLDVIYVYAIAVVDRVAGGIRSGPFLHPLAHQMVLVFLL